MFVLASLCLVLVATATGTQEGEACIDENSHTPGTCQAVNRCEIARNDYRATGNRPTFCSSGVYGQVLVCCRVATNITVANNSSRTEHHPLWSHVKQDVRRVSERKCEEYSRSAFRKLQAISLVPGFESEPITITECNYDFVLFLGGDNALLGEYPHMAAIGWVDGADQYRFKCGGSLISPKFVLTAGQCVTQSSPKNSVPVIVRLGDLNLDDTGDDGANHIDVPIHRIHIHPDYKAPRVYNDIALIELATDVAFNANIRAACLWTKPDYSEFKYAVNSGWGEPYSVNNKTFVELKKTIFSLLENEYCKSLLSGLAKWQHLRDTQVCAGKRGAADACEGNPGSPLQVALRDWPCIFHIIGVTSGAQTCAESNRPAVYTRVYSYLDWIEKIVWPGE